MGIINCIGNCINPFLIGLTMAKKEFYTSGNGKSYDKLNEALDKNPGYAYGFNNLGLDDNISVRPPYGRGDYERFRPNDALPKSSHSIMRACRKSYESVGIIRSVIDLMTETAVEGIQIQNKSKSIQNFYANWAKKVKLQERAERFASYYLIEGNVVVRGKMGTIDTPSLRKMRERTALGKQNKIAYSDIGNIPLEYIFTIRLQLT